MKQYILIFAAFIFFNNTYSSTMFLNELQPFTTDGCSVVPDFSFTDCCIDHDIAYWKGGEKILKDKADIELKQCIAQKANITAALTYYLGVKMGGEPNTLKTYRWGYGWKHQRGYRPISSEELLKIKSIEPTDYHAVEVTKPIRNIFAIDSQSGNYCIDSINFYLKDYFKDESVKIYKDKVMLSSSSARVDIDIKDKSEKMMFLFHRAVWDKCKRPWYNEVLPDLFKAVKVF